MVSPPSLAIASRIAARSTTQGTPVKSCSSTRAGRYWISFGDSAGFFCQSTSAWMSAVETVKPPSSKRSRFSSRTFMRERQAADIAQLRSCLGQRVIGIVLAPDGERGAGAERVLSDLGHAACSPVWRPRRRAIRGAAGRSVGAADARERGRRQGALRPIRGNENPIPPKLKTTARSRIGPAPRDDN